MSFARLDLSHVVILSPKGFFNLGYHSLSQLSYLLFFDTSSTIAKIAVDGAQNKIMFPVELHWMVFEHLAGDFQ